MFLQGLLMLVTILQSTGAAKDYYVVANGGTCLIPNTVCHPLSYYASNYTSYFTNGARLLFLQGNHTLRDEIKITGVTNLVLAGDTTRPVIICSGSGGISITQSTQITIGYISFVNCSPLTFFLTSFVVLVNMSATVSEGTALKLINAMDTAILSSTLTYISQREQSIFTPDSALTAIYVPPQQGNCYTGVNTFILQMKDSTFRGKGASALIISLAHGTSYNLNITLENVTTSDSYRNLWLQLTKSAYFINITNYYSYNGYAAFVAYFHENHHYDGICTVPGVEVPKNIMELRECNIYNNNHGLAMLFGLSALTEHEVISILSSNIYNNSQDKDSFGFQISKNPASDSCSIDIKDTQSYSNKLNLIFNYNYATLENVSIFDSASTGLVVSSSIIAVNKSLTLYNNRGQNGGGLGLFQGSQIKMYSNTVLSITNNSASDKGGGIFGQSNFFSLFDCPIFSSSAIEGISSANISVYISNNTANEGGNDIYGISATSCNNDISFNANIEQSTNAVNFCFCNGALFANCTSHIPVQHVFYGQQVEFSVGLFGVGFTTQYVLTDGSIEMSVNGQPSTVVTISRQCTVLSYTPTVYSTTEMDNQIVLKLQVYDVLQPNTHTMMVDFTVMPCPIGYSISDEGVCHCSTAIVPSDTNNVTCNIDTLGITREGLIWIGTDQPDFVFNATESITELGICIISADCILCKERKVTITMNDTDPQCELNRGKLLCGFCQDGYSQQLGTNECSLCSNSDNLSLIILFAILGVVLVTFMFILNLTVSTGTLNGVLFYVNIVKLYEPIFSISGAYPVFSQVISWFNLDFGIKTCFYNGLDRYAKEWLQFAFPLYIWFIIIIIILLCKISNKLARLLGSNIIPVLSTFLLLSFTKIFRTIVNSLHQRKLTLHCDNSTVYERTVWYEDPNIRYLEGKHLYLFLFAIVVLVVFCIPYVLFLLFNQVLEHRCQNYRCCHFLFKLKPIFDAYNGKVKPRYKFWTGLLIVARIPSLMGITFVNSLVQSRFLLLSVLLVVLGVLLVLSYCFGGIYESHFLNILESWFIFNLLVMVALSITIYDKEGSKVWYTCCIAVFVCSFLVVIAYHVHLKLSSKQWYNKLIAKLKSIFVNNKNVHVENNEEYVPTVGRIDNVTYDSINLRRRDSSAIHLFKPPTDNDFYEQQD